MANALDNALTPINYANKIADFLGLNKWDLSPGSYNGVKFHIIKPGILEALNRFNPAAGVISDIEGLTSAFGNKSNLSAKQTNDALPFGTTTVTTNIQDSGRRKLIMHRIPNANFDIPEDKGFGGDMIKCIGIMFGPSALLAAQNFFRAALNDNAASPVVRNVLVHPVFGTLQNVFLESYERIHSSDYFRAITFNLVFRLTQPISINVPQASLVSSIYSTIKSLLNLYAKIISALGLFSTLTTRFRVPIPGAASISSTQKMTIDSMEIESSILSNTISLNSIVQALSDQAQVGIGITRLLYSNLSPTGATNVSLDSINVDEDLLIPYNGINLTGVSNGVTRIISEYANRLKFIFTAIYTNKFDNVFVGTINDFKSFLSQITTLGKLLLNELEGSTFTYIVPNAMSLEEVLFYNNLDVFDVNLQLKIILLNFKSNASCNLIPKGTAIQIPRGV